MPQPDGIKDGKLSVIKGVVVECDLCPQEIPLEDWEKHVLAHYKAGEVSIPRWEK